MARSKKSSKKNVTKPPRGRKAVAKRLQKAIPPPDNPMLRDLGDSERLSEPKRNQPPMEGESVQPIEKSDDKDLARLRLAALEQSRQMPTADEDEQATNSQG